MEEVMQAVAGTTGTAEVIAEAIVAAGENYKNASAQSSTSQVKEQGAVKYEIREAGNTGMFYVQADRQVITGDDPEVWKKQISGYINETIRKDQDVTFPTSDGHILLLTGRSAYKLSDNHIASIEEKIRPLKSNEEFALKGRAAVHIDELIQVARFRRYREDYNNSHENDIGEDGFNYFKANFRDFDGKYYLIHFSSGISGEEETTYSIGDIKERRFPAGNGSSSDKEALKNGRKPSGTIIYTSYDKSQEVKTAIQIAYEKALKKDAEKEPFGEIKNQDRLSNADKNRLEILGNKTNRLSSNTQRKKHPCGCFLYFKRFLPFHFFEGSVPIILQIVGAISIMFAFSKFSSSISKSVLIKRGIVISMGSSVP